MESKGKLYLIPNVIAEAVLDVIPPRIPVELKHINYFLVENLRTARRYLSALQVYDSIENIQFFVLDKETKETALDELMKPIWNGKDIGIISESGCPGIADPGSMAVLYAHRNKIEVIPLVGPSSILLALMASGLNGQHFVFHGYLPIESKELAKAIKEFERESKKKKQTQIFIETPYRNNALVQNLLKNLSSSTLLCIARGLTGKSESIKTMTVQEWKKDKLQLPKEPAIFLFLSN